MKRHGNLFDKIISLENLNKACDNAAKGKKSRRSIKKTLANKAERMAALHEMLKNGTYTTSSYKSRVLYEPKERVIYILPFYPDRIVHHAIMLQLEPIWDKLLIYDSYACRQNKGQHAGSRKCMSYVRQYKHCLKCDVSKFYPTVDHSVVKEILQRKIKDERLLALLFNIVNSANNIEGNPKGKNIPIGNYLSQWIGNLYLNELDMYVKHTLKAKAYIRYCDDFCFFSNDKAELNDWAGKVKEFVGTKLKQKLSKCNIFSTTHGVDFLGYRHFRTHVLVRKTTAHRIKHRMATVVPMCNSGRITTEQAVSKVASAEGWLKHANAYNFAKSLNLHSIKEKLCEIIHLY